MLQKMKWLSAVVVILGLSVIARADQDDGTIKSVDTTNKAVVLKGIVNDSSYQLTKDANVWLDGFRCKLTDLKADDRAVIVYVKKGDHNMASSIRGLRAAKESTGTINDVFKDKREVTLKGTVSNTTYELVKDGTVWVDGKKGTLADLRAGDQVLVTYQKKGDHYMANDVSVIKRK